MRQLVLPDPQTGQITLLPEGTVLDAGTKQETLSKLPAASQWSPFVHTTADQRFKLQDSWTLEGIDVGIIVWFRQETLVAITLFPYSDAATWDDWPEQYAISQKDQLERVLAAGYGDRRSFPWGEVIATYDPRSVSSSIAIRYGRARREGSAR